MSKPPHRSMRDTKAEYGGGFKIRLTFSDGVSGTVDMEGRLDGPVFRPLQDVARFRQFELTDHTISWPDGADLAPEYLHELVVQSEARDSTVQHEG